MKNNPVQILNIFGKLIVGQKEIIVYLSLKLLFLQFLCCVKMAVQIFGPNIWCDCDVGVDSFFLFFQKEIYGHFIRIGCMNDILSRLLVCLLSSVNLSFNVAIASSMGHL